MNTPTHDPDASASRTTDPASGGTPSLTKEVATGAAWVAGAGFIVRLLGAANTIVVARLLAPEDIGLVALAVVTMQMLQGFSDIGVAQTVVKFQDANRRDLNTLFTISASRGVLLASILGLAAPFLGDFYDDPRVTAAFLGVAIQPLILGLINPKFYEFERALKFSREFIIAVLNKLAGVVVSITVALVFRSFWAIILGMLAGAVTQLFLSYAMRPFLPRPSFSAWRKMFGFSGWLAGVSFFASLNNKLDIPILARLAGIGGSGFYFMGLQLSELLTGQFASPMTRAIYPGLSKLQGEPDRMRLAFLRGVSALGAVAMPAAFGFAFIADDLITVLLGPRWSGAVPVIQILAPIVGMQSLFFATQSYAMAMGRTKLIFIREFIFFSVRMPVFIWAAMTHGLIGAVWAAGAFGVIHIILNLFVYAKISGGKIIDPVLAAHRSIGAVSAMVIYFNALRPTGLDSFSPMLQLSADVITGAALTLAVQFLLWQMQGRPAGIERDFRDAIYALAKRARVTKA